jgi:hypothetical protein
MKEATNELATLISYLNLGSEEMPIEEYLQLAVEDIVDAQYNMVELVDLAWGGDIWLGLNLNKEPMNDVDDRPTPRVKLSQTRDTCPITIKCCSRASFAVSIIDMMDM